MINKLSNWIKAFILGIVIWFVATMIFGFFVGILDLDQTNFFKNNSNLNNFLLLPIGIWLGFRIKKVTFFGEPKLDEALFNKQMDKITKGEEEEFLKVKSNKSKNPLENNLIDEKHISALSWTVACWRLTIENKTKKMMLEKKVAKFCRLFLAQEKKRKKVKDYNRADVRMLKMLSLMCSLKTVDALMKKHGWTYDVAKEFEKEINYN